MKKFKAILGILKGETTFYASEEDKEKSWRELDDMAIAGFTRRYLSSIDNVFDKVASDNKMDLDSMYALHGSLALYKLLIDNNSTEATFEHEGVTIKGVDYGNWKVVVSKD
jgi:hypothetical protein